MHVPAGGRAFSRQGAVEAGEERGEEREGGDVGEGDSGEEERGGVAARFEEVGEVKSVDEDVTKSNERLRLSR
ncbi:MAG: hypothetical protein ACK5AZ_11310 [Bryobacteraceae bacterium]